MGDAGEGGAWRGVHLGTGLKERVRRDLKKLLLFFFLGRWGLVYLFKYEVAGSGGGGCWEDGGVKGGGGGGSVGRGCEGGSGCVWVD